MQLRCWVGSENESQSGADFLGLGVSVGGPDRALRLHSMISDGHGMR